MVAVEYAQMVQLNAAEVVDRRSHMGSTTSQHPHVESLLR
jgi:hypothetical protein